MEMRLMKIYWGKPETIYLQICDNQMDLLILFDRVHAGTLKETASNA